MNISRIFYADCKNFESEQLKKVDKIVTVML